MLRDLFSLFPAYAGVILHHNGYYTSEWPFPRIRGGDPNLAHFKQALLDFSPHTRG